MKNALLSVLAVLVTFRVFATLAVAFAASTVTMSVSAQDGLHLRNDCRLASQILRTGHPAPHRDTVAARVLASHAGSQAGCAGHGLALLIGDSTRTARISVSHSSVREGSVPVTAAVIAEIRAAMESVASEDPDAEIRAAAKAIAEQIRWHLAADPAQPTSVRRLAPAQCMV